MTTEPLDVWAAVPAVGVLTSALRAVGEALTATRQRPAPAMPTPGDLADNLSAGAPLPDVAAIVAAYVADQQTRDAELRLLADTRAALDSRLSEVRRRHADDALAVLAKALADIIGQARALLPSLRNVYDANDALRAGKAYEWQQFADLAAQHGRIRAAQVGLVADSLGDRRAAVHLVDKCGRVANIEEHEPLRSRIADGESVGTLPALNDSHVTHHRHADAPPLAADATGYLRWLCRDDVQPWVPTVAELKAAADRIDEAIRDADRARTTAVTGGEHKPFVGRGSTIAAFRR